MTTLSSGETLAPKISPILPGSPPQVGKSLKLLGRFPQPVQHRVRIDLKDPRGGANAQAFRQTGQRADNQLHRQAFAVKERPVRLQKVAAARATVQLAPGATAGMAIGAEVT
jgi:hypothetical protein